MKLVDAEKFREELLRIMPERSEVLLLLDEQPVVADCVQYVPMIQIRDFGFEEPHDRTVGDDPRHDWLEICEDGSLRYRNLLNGDGTPGGYRFLPTFVAKGEYGDKDGNYITCRRAYILESEWEENDEE